MRLLTVLPHVLISARPIAQLSAVAFALTGCAALGGVSATSSLGPSSTRSITLGARSYNPGIFYLTNGVSRSVQRDYVDRYACASGAALVCECTSRLAETCDCRC